MYVDFISLFLWGKKIVSYRPSAQKITNTPLQGSNPGHNPGHPSNRRGYSPLYYNYEANHDSWNTLPVHPFLYKYHNSSSMNLISPCSYTLCQRRVHSSRTLLETRISSYNPLFQFFRSNWHGIIAQYTQSSHRALGNTLWYPGGTSTVLWKTAAEPSTKFIGICSLHLHYPIISQLLVGT